jgi:enterochelin esterase-like enzyme
VPKGTATKFTLAPGKDYPGSAHNCTVYVPAQYDPGKPTPFMIFLDGSQALDNSMRVPVVLGNLIAKHDLPTTIAIFVDPGILPVASDVDQNRYNRIDEYDSLTSRFSDFLVNELIPEVAKQYNLSKNPDARALSGMSTGAAITAIAFAGGNDASWIYLAGNGKVYRQPVKVTGGLRGRP